MVECQDEDIVPDNPCFLIIVEVLVFFGNELTNPVFFKKVAVEDVPYETSRALVHSHLNVFGLTGGVFVFRVNLNLVECKRFFRVAAVLSELALDLFLNLVNNNVDVKVFDLGVQVLITYLLDAAHPLDVVVYTFRLGMKFLFYGVQTFKIILIFKGGMSFHSFKYDAIDYNL